MLSEPITEPRYNIHNVDGVFDEPVGHYYFDRDRPVYFYENKDILYLCAR